MFAFFNLCSNSHPTAFNVSQFTGTCSESSTSSANGYEYLFYELYLTADCQRIFSARNVKSQLTARYIIYAE